jgi:chromosome segregation ATPase
MITRLRASNFRSLGERVHLRLGPQLTALVGPNGSGKSNVEERVF